MGAGSDGPGDFVQVQRHRLGVAERQDEASPFSLGRADGPEQIGRLGPLVVRRHGPGSASCPAPGDFVLLAYAGFILPPDFYGFACRLKGGDLVQAGGEVFLNASSASVSWAWWRGRADSLRNPMARNSRLSVCLLIDRRNSSNSHCAKSTRRQRTTPWAAGIGPASTMTANAWRWTALRIDGLPGALPFRSPDGPSALKASTQSRNVCNPTPPTRAASVRERPS